jgi:hypothetical protein
MEIELQRGLDNGVSTTGQLKIDGVLECFTLEDTEQPIKILGKTRIPSGRYRIKLRFKGSMVKRYKSRYNLDGMLWLQDVSNFKYIYIHIGNISTDTDGCILVGNGLDQSVLDGAVKQSITHSTDAYKSIHPQIATAIAENHKVFITIKD